MKSTEPLVFTSVLIVTIVAIVSGCANPVDTTEPIDATPVEETAPEAPEEPAPPSSRVVYVGWDENELAHAIGTDLDEFHRSGIDLATFEVLFLRESVIRDGAIEVLTATGVEQREITLPTEPSLFDLSTVTEIRRYLDALKKVPLEIVILSGHGRGWRGIGVREHTPDLVASPTELAALIPVVDGTKRTLIVDAGYAANVEILYALASNYDRVVATTGPRSDDGLDYHQIGQELNGLAPDEQTNIDSVTEIFAHSMENDSPRRTVVASGTQTESVDTSIARIVDAVPQHIGTQEEQTTIQSFLLDQAVVPELPGHAFIHLGAVAQAVGVECPPEIAPFLLHLVNLDELGTPRGHDTSYRVDAESTTLDARFQTLGWAPDLLRREGVLFDIWYRFF